MKTPPSNPHQRWETLLQKARTDVGPPADSVALMRAVRSAELPSPRGWLGDFTALFAPSRALPVCLACAGVLAFFTAWQAWDAWQALPWAQMLVVTMGGVS